MTPAAESRVASSDPSRESGPLLAVLTTLPGSAGHQLSFRTMPSLVRALVRLVLRSASGRDHVVHRPAVDRFGKQLQAASCSCPGHQLRVDATFGQQNAAEVALSLAGVLNQLQAQLIGHIQIEDDNVEIPGPQQMSCCSLVVSASYIQTQCFEVIEQVVAEVTIIFDDQQRKTRR